MIFKYLFSNSLQSARKSGINYYWINRNIYNNIKKYLESLCPFVEEDDINILDLDMEMYNGYNIDYSSELLTSHTKAMYKNKIVTINHEKTYELEHYICENVIINIDGDDKKVPIKKLTLPYNIKE